MFLSSTDPLPDGSHVIEAPYPEIWDRAREAGLTERDYDETWFVYPSRAEYLESLD